MAEDQVLAKLPPAESEFGVDLLVDELSMPEAQGEMFAEVANVAGSCTTVVSTATFPYAAVAFLKINIGLGAKRGTAFFISDRLLLTAAHCVKSQVGNIDSIDVFPALNGEQGVSIRTTTFEPFEGYLNDPTDPANDFGMILLPPGSSGVAFGFDALSDDVLGSRPVHLQGYPQGTTQQAFCTGPIVGMSATLLAYDIPSDQGESGGPLWPDDPDRAIATAIHIGEIGGRPAARRFDQAVLAEIARWSAA